MDISTTSTGVNSSSATTEKSSSTQQSSQKSDTSFQDEMNKVSSDKSAKEAKITEAKDGEIKNEETTDKISEKNNSVKETDKQRTDKQEATGNTEFNNTLYSEINFNGIKINNTANANINDVMTSANRELENITLIAGCKTTVDYTSITISEDDAKFFTDLVQNTDKTLQNVADIIQQGTEREVQTVQQNVKISETLMKALSDSIKNNQPLRIDFDKDISVIIRVDKDGILSARFIPGDSAVEQYLRQNMQALRERFDDKNLAYKELSYSSQQQRQQNKNKNNKENNRE